MKKISEIRVVNLTIIIKEINDKAFKGGIIITKIVMIITKKLYAIVHNCSTACTF